MGKYSYSPYYFDADWISVYPEQKEKIMIGGAGYGDINGRDGGLLAVSSISLANDRKTNFSRFAECTTIFDVITKGESLSEAKTRFKKGISRYFALTCGVLHGLEIPIISMLQQNKQKGNCAIKSTT